MTRFTNTHHRRNITALSASGLSLMLLASGCGGNGGSDGGETAEDAELLTVDVAYSTSSAMSAAPIAVAQDQGFFEEGGCQLGEEIEGQGGADPLRAVIDGNLDMGEVATNAVIDGYLAGAAITVVGSGHQLPYDFTFAVLPDSGIDGIEDMEGKRWGYTNPGSASEDLSYLLAERADIPADSVERVPTSGMGGGIAMLESGEVDAALMIPIVHESRADDFVLAFEALDVIEAYQKTVFIASDDFLDQSPEGVRCVLDGVNRGMQFIQENPEDAAEIYADVNGDYEAEALATDFQLALDRNALDGGVGFNPVGLENVAEARALRTGEDEAIPWEDFFDESFLPDGVTAELPSQD